MMAAEFDIRILTQGENVMENQEAYKRAKKKETMR